MSIHFVSMPPVVSGVRGAGFELDDFAGISIDVLR